MDKPALLLDSLIARNQKQQTSEARTALLWLSFGRAIRAERKRKKIKLERFASEMGISGGMVSYLESGARKWNFEMAMKAVKIIASCK